MLEKISERDRKFQESIGHLPNSWCNSPNSFLALEGKESIIYIRAAEWKPEIYYTHTDLLYSLIMAYTDNHKNVHDELSRRAVKSYHLNFGLLLLPACEDKLAQLLREFLEIKHWGKKVKKKNEANEDNTHLRKIVEFLKKKHSNPKLKKIVVEDYWDNKPNGEEDVNELANKIKHRWSQHYVGIKDRPSKGIEVNAKGNFVSGVFGSRPVSGEILYKDIEKLRKANNSFVKCALSCEEILEQYHKGAESNRAK